MKELKILKLKDFITLHNILFVKDSLTNNGMTNFNPQLHITKIQDQLVAST